MTNIFFRKLGRVRTLDLTSRMLTRSAISSVSSTIITYLFDP